MNGTQAGWYRDPNTPGQLRYFDGATWTEHVQPDPAQVTVQQFAPPPAAPAAMPPGYGAPGAAMAQPYQPVQQVQQVQINQISMGKQEEKSVGIALLLAGLFGPLGMFYSTITGAVVMLLVNIVLGIPTFGLIFFITWPVGMAWAAIAASNANKAAAPAIALSSGAPPMTPQYAPQPQPYPQQAPMAPGPTPGPPPALPQSTGHDPFANGFERTHELPQAQPPADGSWYG